MGTAVPPGTIQGLASNIQWQSLIDQIMAAEQARTLTPVTNKITADQTGVSTWSSYQSLVGALQSAATTLRDTAFSAMVATGGTDSSGRAVLSATATAGAVAGTYTAQVASLAAADQLGGAILASSTTALGMSGEFFVNGTRVSVATSDTLSNIRDKINALNSGATPTGVAASILTVGTSSSRLIVNATQLGASGVQLVDGSTGILSQLGIVDGNAPTTTTAAGGAQSYRLQNSTTAVATLLGMTSVPAATSIIVGNTTVSINLATDSLATIRANIVAAGVSATLSTPTYNGTAMSELDVAAPVSAVAGNAVSQRIVQVLGFSTGRTAVTQVLANSSVWTDSSNIAATTATALSALKVAGTAANLAVGDSIVLSGTRGDGVAVSKTITLNGTETVQTLLSAVNATDFLGSTTRSATATISSNGTLMVTDGTAGSSQLAMSMVVQKANGTTASLGQVVTQTTGYNRELTHGSNANVSIDGTMITRTTNTISDAIPGLTLNLLAAEPGTPVTVTVAPDTNTTVNDVRLFVSAYNAAATFVQTQTAKGGSLAFNVSLRSSLRSITQQLVANVPGTTGTLTNPSSVGVSLDKTGQMQLDATALTAALSSNPTGVAALFARTVTTSAGLTYLSDTSSTQTGTFAVNVTSAATQATLTGSGFTGTYSGSGTPPDQLVITDNSTVHTAYVSLVNGDTLTTILGKLNSAFVANTMNVTAQAGAGGQVVITSTAYGSAAKINFSYGYGATNAQAQLGLVPGLISGTDIVGTIGGVAAVGVGQHLTGANGSPAAGLALLYTGTTAYTGQVVHTLGLTGGIASAADFIARSGDGLTVTMTTALQAEISALTQRSSDIQARIAIHRATLTSQFIKMEAALSTLQSQQAALLSQITTLQSTTK